MRERGKGVWESVQEGGGCEGKCARKGNGEKEERGGCEKGVCERERRGCTRGVSE